MISIEGYPSWQYQLWTDGTGCYKKKKAGGSVVHSHIELLSEIKDSLNYMEYISKASKDYNTI